VVRTLAANLKPEFDIIILPVKFAADDLESEYQPADGRLIPSSFSGVIEKV
jgi:hypothetical protein